MVSITRRAFAAVAVAAAILFTACGSKPAASSDVVDTSSSSVTVVDGQGSEKPLPSTAALSADVASGKPATSGPATSESTASPAKDQAYVPESSRDTGDKRLYVIANGKTVYIKNGGQLILGNGLAVEFFVDPYPPSTLRVWLDLYLTKDGNPVTDASMGIDYDMLAMIHGPWWGEAENLGGGHYLFTLGYIMFGPWEQTVTIRIGLQRIRIPVVLVANP